MIKPELIKLLACPKCRGPLHESSANPGLICQNCNVVYPVEDDIPVLLIERAVPLADSPQKKEN